MSADSERGHRAVEHTADEIVEAWGPTRAACLEEAVLGLVAVFADPRSAAGSGEHEVTLDADDDQALLLAALDEVVFLTDARSAVPVGVEARDDGEQVHLRLHLAPTKELDATGPPPKAVSRGGLELIRDGERWRARALVDL